MRRIRERVEILFEQRRRVPWPDSEASSGTAVVAVNYNTCELTSYLVFSLCRVLRTGDLDEIVVVDNGSSDESPAFLDALHEGGVITLLHNRRAPYHGPGLNAGISHLAPQQTGRPVRLVWVLDSDTVVLRQDTLELARDAMYGADAVALGQVNVDHFLPGGLANIASLLLRPAQVWRPPIPPFREAGEPAVAMQRTIRDLGMRIADFPFFRGGYMLHLGRGTLREVAEGNHRRNRYYDWAVENRSFHFDGNPDGPRLLASFRSTFYDEVGEFRPDNLVAACLRAERIVGLAT